MCWAGSMQVVSLQFWVSIRKCSSVNCWAKFIHLIKYPPSWSCSLTSGWMWKYPSALLREPDHWDRAAIHLCRDVCLELLQASDASLFFFKPEQFHHIEITWVIIRIVEMIRANIASTHFAFAHVTRLSVDPNIPFFAWFDYLLVLCAWSETVCQAVERLVQPG